MKLIKKSVKCDQIQNLFYHVKKIVTHVRQSHRQIKLERKLQLYSDTRFNGGFYILNIFLNVYNELDGVINNNFIDYLTDIDKKLLEELCVFLKLSDQAVDQLSDEERPTMHKVLLIRQLLLDRRDVKLEDSDELKSLEFFLVSEY
jgi:hypothetical protein